MGWQEVGSEGREKKGRGEKGRGGRIDIVLVLEADLGDPSPLSRAIRFLVEKADSRGARMRCASKHRQITVPPSMVRFVAPVFEACSTAPTERTHVF